MADFLWSLVDSLFPTDSPLARYSISATPSKVSHLVRINGYSFTKNAPNGSFVEAMSFTVAGRRWQIRFYPNGHGEAAAGGVVVSVYVGLASAYRPGEKPVLANARFTLLDRDGKPVPSYIHTMPGVDFAENDFGTNIKRADLVGYLKDDGFVVRCDLCFVNAGDVGGAGVVKPPQQHQQVMVKDSVKVPPSNLYGHLGDLLWKKQGCGDMSIDVQGMTFTAHRWMLAARSSVMAAELDLSSSSSSSDADIKTMTLRVDDDMEPKVFRALLHFIYTDALPEMTKEEAAAMATGLHVAAGRYEMERLQLICEDTLCKNVSVDTVASTLMFAEKNGCRVLKAVCLDFLSCDKLEQVRRLDDFKSLTRICPEIINELLAQTLKKVREAHTLNKIITDVYRLAS